MIVAAPNDRYVCICKLRRVALAKFADIVSTDVVRLLIKFELVKIARLAAVTFALIELIAFTCVVAFASHAELTELVTLVMLDCNWVIVA